MQPALPRGGRAALRPGAPPPLSESRPSASVRPRVAATCASMPRCPLAAGALAVAALSTIPAQTRWLDLAASGPGVRSDVALVHDAARDRVVLTGGWDGTRNLADVWEFDGSAWQVRSASGGPGPHSSHALAYDEVRRRVVLFGGWDGARFLGDTWEWDGAAGSWTQRQPPSSPTARYGHRLAYDPARRVVVLFGGYCGTGCALGDTWEFDGAAGTWTQRTPAVSPPARYSFGMCHDEQRRRIVLFGGRLLSARGNDTWEWDGTAGTWTQRSPSAPLPAARSAHALAFDAARGRAVLFGGFTGVWNNETWEWDGAAWLQRSPANPPAGRGFFGLTHDPVRGRTVLYGGDNGSTAVGGTFAHAPVVHARVSRFGAGCPQRVAIPELRAAGGALPWLGTTVDLEAHQLAPAAATAALALGGSATAWQGLALPFDLGRLGMPGCALLAAPELWLPAPAQNGIAAWRLGIPADAALLGTRAFGQAFASEPGANPLGVVATQAIELLLGGL